MRPVPLGCTTGDAATLTCRPADLVRSLSRRPAKGTNLRAAGAPQAMRPVPEKTSVGEAPEPRGDQATVGWQLLVIEFRVHAARNAELSRRYAGAHVRTVEALAGVL